MLHVLTSASILFAASFVNANGRGWPEGFYGLPMPKTGCPLDNDSDWEIGRRVHETEYGSHASTPVHLSEVDSSNTNRVVQKFCMKTTYDSAGFWMPGRYCILKKSQCPAKFQDGFIYWDDAAPFWGSTVQTFSGVLPDGEYSRNTKIFYCCRNDALATQRIRLPTNAPFYLLKFGDICQEVDGMTSTEEWLHWSGEEDLNLDMQGGQHPKLVRSRQQQAYTRMYYCYYSADPPSDPVDISSLGIHTILLVLCVLAVTVGTILLCVVLLVAAQRVWLCWKQRQRNRRQSGHGTTPSSRCVDHVIDVNGSSRAASVDRPPTYEHAVAAGIQQGSDVAQDTADLPSYDDVLREKLLVVA